MNRRVSPEFQLPDHERTSSTPRGEVHELVSQREHESTGVEREPTLNDLRTPDCTDGGFLTKLNAMVGKHVRGIIAAEVITTGGLAAYGASQTETGKVYVAAAQVEGVRDAWSQEIDARLFEGRRIDELDAVHRTAAEQVKADQLLASEFSAEELEAVAQVLEEFSTKRMVDALSVQSGIPSWELARSLRTHSVAVYANSMLEQIDGAAVFGKAEDELRTLGGMNRTVSGSRDIATGSHGDTTLHLGVYDTRVQSILLNLSDIKRVSGGDIARFKAGVLEVLYHEHLHSFPMLQFERGTVEHVLYEGMTEMLSDRLMQELHSGERNTYGGYSDGGAAGATFIFASLSPDGQKELWRGYLQGDRARIASAYDSEYGEGQFTELIAPYDTKPDATLRADQLDKFSAAQKKADLVRTNIALLDRAVHDSGNLADDIVREANSHLGQSSIIAFDRDGIQGVAIAHVNGYVYAGLLHVEHEKGTRTVALVPDKVSYPVYTQEKDIWLYNVNVTESDSGEHSLAAWLDTYDESLRELGMNETE